MAASAQQQYVVNFAIGAKLLSSFSGAMNAAQTRMKTMEKTVKGVSTAVKGMTGILLGALAALGGRAIFNKIFEGAEEAAIAAEQRTRRMVTSLLRLQSIAARGRGYSEDQVKILQKHTEELAKHSVYSQDILNAGEDQLAVYAVPPKYIEQAIGPMQDLLAVSKGVTANEGDMSQLANAFGKAIKTGMTKPLKEFGIVLSPLEQQYLKAMSKAGDLQGAYNFLLGKMRFAAGEAARLMTTPQGRIKKAQENILEMGKRVKQALLPDQAAMQEAWTNAMLSLEPALTAFERSMTHLKTWGAQEFGDLVKALSTPDAKQAIDDLTQSVKGLGASFGSTHTEGKSLGTMLGEWLSGEIKQTGEDFIHLERIIVNIQRHWTILEGAFIGGWQRIESAFGKLTDLWEKFKASITDWKPPWWMPLNPLTIGQKIYKGGAGVRSAVGNWNAGATQRAITAAGGGPSGGVASAASGVAAAGGASNAAPLSAAAASSIQAERAGFIKELQTPYMQKLVAATLSTETSGAESQKNVYEALINRAAAYKIAGKYHGMEQMIKGGFYGPWNRRETAAVMSKGISEARLKQVAEYTSELAAGRNVLGGLTDQGMINEIKGAKKKFGEDYYGMMGFEGEKQTAAYRAGAGQVAAPTAVASENKPPPLLAAVPGMAAGGIAMRPMLAQLAERGAEAVVPLGRGGRGLGGMMGTAVHFMPNITIHGGGSGAEIQDGMVDKLRDLSREFVGQFKRAQQHERRLSYEGGYG
jgi:hypothetical protein